MRRYTARDVHGVAYIIRFHANRDGIPMSSERLYGEEAEVFCRLEEQSQEAETRLLSSKSIPRERLTWRDEFGKACFKTTSYSDFHMGYVDTVVSGHPVGEKLAIFEDVAER